MKKKLKYINLQPFLFYYKIGIKFLFIFILLSSFSGKAQLPDFIFQVTKTDESCPGNGSLTFNVSNTAPGVSMNFKVYKLPDTATLVANLSTNFVGGLSNGTYRIIATQTNSAGSSAQTAEITINDNTIYLDYQLTSTDAVCGNDASISISIISGNAVSYEIMSGPITRPPQATNQFNNLSEGIYRIRVYDNCGEAFVQTRTIFREDINIEISNVNYPNENLPSCHSVTIMHTITSSNLTLKYPLQYKFTTYPPSGGSVDYTGTINSGSNASADISQVLPVGTQDYQYDLKVIDGCGNEYSISDQINSNIMQALVGSSSASCDKYYLTLNPINFVPPYTVNFINAPAGFNPSDFNALHPGPFTDELTEYTSLTASVPLGEYTVEIKDFCGRIDRTTYTIIPIQVNPEIRITTTSGCSTTADVRIRIPNRQIVSAIITSGPADYTSPIPHTISHLINSVGELLLDDIPAGTYIIALEDSCGTSHRAEVLIVPDYSLFFGTGRDCEIGKGTLFIGARNTSIEHVEIIAAPQGFPQALPYDVSFNIASGFTMAELIPGRYTVKVRNGCGIETIFNPIIIGYETTRNEYSITPHCGSFDLTLNHTSNIPVEHFWLQKFNPLTNTWGHPETNLPYTEGNVPSTSTAFAITNNITNYSLAYAGTFRILKNFVSTQNGQTATTKDCIEILAEFDYIGHPEIVSLKSLTCNGIVSEVQIFVEGGVLPYTYEIIKRNGIDFHVDNGTNNIFSNLGPDIYSFKVTDACGEFRSRDYDVAELPPLANANQAEILLCDDSSQDGIEEFHLSNINDVVLGPDQPLSEYGIKYYNSSNEAINQLDPLPEAYPSTSKIIYARVDNLNGIDCFAIASINLRVLEYPKILLGTEVGMCDSNPVTLTANTGFDSYLWSNNDGDNITTFDTPGNYSLKVTKIYGDIICEGIHDFEIINSSQPVIQEIVVSDWTDDENIISVMINDSQDFEYSLDNIHFQDDNNFYGLEIGEYTVYVRSKLGCGPDDFEKVLLLNYPKFFTPNGDGYNDFWKVKLSSLEPGMITYIFDRYGKLITGFKSTSRGWDGNLNGKPLPSTDYWFVVKRENGKIHRGHFSMKR